MSAMKKNVMTVSGIRPDFIRMSSIFKKLDEADWCNHILVHTGQNFDYELNQIFFEENIFDDKPSARSIISIL